MSKALDFALQEIEMKDSTDIRLDTLELKLKYNQLAEWKH